MFVLNDQVYLFIYLIGMAYETGTSVLRQQSRKLIVEDTGNDGVRERENRGHQASLFIIEHLEWKGGKLQKNIYTKVFIYSL